MRGCLATWCWRGFGGVVDSSLALTASGFGYLENQSFEQTPRNVTAPNIRNLYIPPNQNNTRSIADILTCA